MQFMLLSPNTGRFVTLSHQQTQEELEKRDALIAQKDTVLAKSLADLQLELATLKENLAEERKKHARTAASREGKVHSLVENQELLSSHKSTIEEQVIDVALACAQFFLIPRFTPDSKFRLSVVWVRQRMGSFSPFIPKGCH